MASKTDDWLAKADNSNLPDEDIPLLSSGESGESYGWPSGLMGPQASARLHLMGITSTSALIQMANEMDVNSWKRLFGSKTESEQNAVWPRRYANVYGYLQRVIQSPQNAREYKSRLAKRLSNMQVAETGLTTAAWAVFADTQHLPQENIPEVLPAGYSGGSYGWPKGMMGKESLERLHRIKKITKASELIQKGLTMDHAAFCAEFKDVWPTRFAGVHLYLNRAVLCNADNMAEFRRRGGSVGGGAVPNGLIASAVIFVVALLASFFANDAFLSHLASLAVCTVGIYVATKQSLGICMCLGAYAVIAQILATFTFSSTAALPVFLLFIYIFVDHHARLPSVLIPSMFR
jgi:hypothetical protein